MATAPSAHHDSSGIEHLEPPDMEKMKPPTTNPGRFFLETIVEYLAPSEISPRGSQ